MDKQKRSRYYISLDVESFIIQLFISYFSFHVENSLGMSGKCRTPAVSSLLQSI